MRNRIKILLALAASIAMIAIGQRGSGEKDARTQKAQVEGVDAEAWFI